MSNYIISDDITNLTSSVSLPFYFLYLPKAETISGDFVYNYYTRNEGISEVVSLDAVDAESDEYNFILENWESGTYPRQINLEFSNTSGFPAAEISDLATYVNDQKIIYEESPFNNSFSGVIVADTAVDEKIYETARILEDTETASSDILNVAKLQSAGYGFSKAGTRESVIASYQNDIKSIVLGVSLNNLIVSDVLKTASRWQTSFYVDEYASLFSSAQTVQDSAVGDAAGEDLFTISEDKLNTIVTSISSISSESTGTASAATTSEVVGYIIEKYGEQLDGSTLRYSDIIISNPSTTTYSDSSVRYGGVYKYKIRTVYRCTFVTLSGENEDGSPSYVVMSILAASEGAQAVISCVESSPPLPPGNITFQQTLSGLYIRWNFPINTQKDIKRFQVFRRKKIESPFILQKEINFDKTIYPYTTGESIPISLLQIESAPVKHYLDSQFNDLDDDYIYALCSIDAHGLSSGYSDQYRVRFDKFTGKLIVTRISTEGAPKPFPNVNILSDFFSDVIKDSGHSRIRLYFDPEYNDVTRSGSSLSLVSKTSTGEATYKIGITELNLGQSQTIDIIVNDPAVTADGIPVSIARFYTAS